MNTVPVSHATTSPMCRDLRSPRVAEPVRSFAWQTRCQPQPPTRRTAAVPTNEQRRATAKRKLERQLERRAAQEPQRRIPTISWSAVAALVIIGAVVATFVFTSKDSGSTTASADTTTATSGAPAQPAADGQLPAFAAAADPGATCQSPAAAAATKPTTPPRTGKVPTDPATVSV